MLCGRRRDLSGWAKAGWISLIYPIATPKQQALSR